MQLQKVITHIATVDLRCNFLVIKKFYVTGCILKLDFNEIGEECKGCLEYVEQTLWYPLLKQVSERQEPGVMRMCFRCRNTSRGIRGWDCRVGKGLSR